MDTINLSNIILGRMRKLKGNRERIVGYRKVDVNVPITPDDDGKFYHEYRGRNTSFNITGGFKNGVLTVSCIEILALRNKYLRKHYRKTIGYNLSAKRTNVN